MTTIAFRDGVLASDSKITGNDVFVGSIKKIFKIVLEEELSWVDKLVFRREPEQIEYLVGMAGGLEDCKEYIQCIFYGKPQTRGFEASIMAICMDEDDKYVITKYDGNGTQGFQVQADYASIGSGVELALGAMYHGATAVEAVEAAIYHDNTSGGEIQSLTFGDDDGE